MFRHGLVYAQDPEIFMSMDQEGIVRTDSFSSHDIVYIHAVFLDLKETEHEAAVEWINPRGKYQDSAAHRFTGARHNKIWFWLKLHSEFGGKILESFETSLGMEEFMGEWIVRLYLNDDIVASRRFYVGF